MLYHWAMRPPTTTLTFPLKCPRPSFYFKKTPPVGLEPTTLRLKAARSTDWARKALAYTSLYRYMKIFWYRQDTMPTQCNIIWCPYNLRYSLWIFYVYFLRPYSLTLKKGLRRESNPGHPHPKRVFYHLTTKPSCYYAFIDAVLPTIPTSSLFLPSLLLFDFF